MLGADAIRRPDGSTLRVRAPKAVASKQDDLHSAIARGTTPFCPIAEAVKVTYTIQAVYKAARGGVKPISFKELGDINGLIGRAAAQRCLFSELGGMPEWAL